LIVTQNWTGVSRVTLSPKSYWIASSSEPDRVYLSDLMSRGMSLHDAINKAATEHPYGVGSASSTP
jgi:hypothetical protein